MTTRPDPLPPRPDAAWARTRELFDAAVAVPAEQRAGVVAASTADASVKAAVLSLLGHHFDDDATGASTEPPGATGAAPSPPDAGFLRLPAAAALLGQPLPAGTTEAITAAARTGERFGAWEIVRPIGAGGMGEVFEARRADGAYQGRAAIKLLRHGLGVGSAEVLQRFAQERQALARLNHPNIAALFDAGLGAQGGPYFVMEFVSGEAFDTAAASRPLEARIALFLQLADAVAHAHRNLLVHRDLKPGNVLVTPEGQVKLLDFGVAKALDPLASADLDTTIGPVRPYTPHYASPEQVRGAAVGTSTDIYSLGVLLYQMLTGVRPTGRAVATPAEAARSVLEEQPRRPSSLGTDAVADPDWPARRRRLEGDLDNIVLKALEKDIDRRYPSVEALAEDLRRHLGGLPVSAGAPSRRYLLGKFVRRHRGVVVAAAVAAVAVLGALGASLRHGRLTELARDDAQRQLGLVKQITTDIVFRFGDTADGLAGGLKAQEALFDSTLAALAPALAASPDDPDLNAIAASLLGRLAELRGNVARASPERAREAEATVERAHLAAARAWPARRGDWRFVSWHVRTLVVQAMLLGARGQRTEALQALGLAVARATEALALPQTVPGRTHLLAARGGALLVTGQMQSRRSTEQAVPGDAGADAIAAFDRAEADHRALLADPALLDEIDRNAAPGDTPAAATFRHQIGSILGARASLRLQLGELEAARRDAGQALVIRNDNLRLDPRNAFWRDGLVNESHTLSVALLRLGDARGALEANRLCRETTESLAGEAGPDSKWAHQRQAYAAQHGRALAALGRQGEALEAFDAALAHHRRLRAAAADSGSDAAAAKARHGQDVAIATLQAQSAGSLAALGRAEPALLRTREADDALRALLAGPSANRELRLAAAEARALHSTLEPEDIGARLREEAIALYREAAAARPLAPDVASAYSRLAEPRADAPVPAR